MLMSAASIGSKKFASKLTNHSSNSSIRAAQKAVHSYPGQPEVWALLSAAAFACDLQKGIDSLSSLAVSTARLALQKGKKYFICCMVSLKTSLS